ncbi:uncharacterized protein [Ptychodera flava]|uniref:uncharacterized protein n=1 Tax=Ptychodera flava TaxID=63121 RepID=UPI003969C83D
MWFNSLGKHKVRDCKSKGKCFHSRRKHHTSQCTTESSHATTALGPSPNNQVTDTQTHATGNRGDDKPTSSTQPATQIGVNFARTESNSGKRKMEPGIHKTAEVPITYGPNTINATVLFDEGSDISFITRDLVTKLDMKPQTSDVYGLKRFGDKTANARSFEMVTFALQTRDGPKSMSALIVPEKSISVKNKISRSVLNLPHIKGLKLAHPPSDAESFEISLLIGTDYYWDFIEDDIVRGPGPTAVLSKFGGYLLSGRTGIRNAPNADATTLHIATTTVEEEMKLQNYWDLETIGIRDQVNAKDTEVSEFELYRDTHYELKTENTLLSYHGRSTTRHCRPIIILLKNAHAMVRRLTPDLLKVYNNILIDQQSRDFIEEVDDDDKANGHYLPHRSVKKDSTTTPIRVVYDCSCRQSDSPSLNDCLQTGPPLLNDLSSILLRFRVHDIALSSDIEKAFLNVRLDENDRKFTKFLWLSDPSDPESPFKVYRFKTVLFGAVCSPFILNAVVKTHLESNNNTPIAADLKDNIYVDNVISGVNNTTEATKYYTDANSLMKSAGFNLRSWSSNNDEIRKLAAKDKTLEMNTNVGVLGMRWLTDSDQLAYAKKKDVKKSDYLATKREVTQVTASLFDPLGYLSPVQVKAKTFIQDIWKRNLDWDEPLETDLANRWKHIVSDFNASTEIKIDRRYFAENTSADHELHVFADASCKAYGAAAYLRCGDQTSLVMAKTRVAPIKDYHCPASNLWQH